MRGGELVLEKKITVNHRNDTILGPERGRRKKKKSILAFKYLVIILVARVWLSTKFLFFFHSFYFYLAMTMYRLVCVLRASEILT